MPRVTILLTCYNHLRHLKTALECVRAQTYRDFEVVALDDGSTDGTREWLEQVQRDEPGLPLRLVFNEQNVGTYATLNRGIAEAQGELVAEFNDDDVWMPTKLERQVAAMDSDPRVGLVHTSGWFIGDDGERLATNPLGFEWPKTGSGDVLLELVPHNKIIASSVLVRAACFKEVGEFNESYFGSGDWEMWFRIAEKYRVAHIDEPLTLYRVHAGSASHQSERVMRDDVRIREWITTRLPLRRGRCDARALRDAEAHNWACVGTSRVWLGDAKGGRRAYVESLKLVPWRFKSALRYLATFLPARAFRALN